jgi:hypothetical protein
MPQLSILFHIALLHLPYMEPLQYSPFPYKVLLKIVLFLSALLFSTHMLLPNVLHYHMVGLLLKFLHYHTTYFHLLTSPIPSMHLLHLFTHHNRLLAFRL